MSNCVEIYSENAPHLHPNVGLILVDYISFKAEENFTKPFLVVYFLHVFPF